MKNVKKLKLEAEVKSQLATLYVAQEEVNKATAELTAQREALVAKIQPLENELRVINKKISAMEHAALDADLKKYNDLKAELKKA